ncbi:hypothetical protein MRX96_046605 [Rhipicephalus microplus]
MSFINWRVATTEDLAAHSEQPVVMVVASVDWEYRGHGELEYEKAKSQNTVRGKKGEKLKQGEVTGGWREEKEHPRQRSAFSYKKFRATGPRRSIDQAPLRRSVGERFKNNKRRNLLRSRAPGDVEAGLCRQDCELDGWRGEGGFFEADRSRSSSAADGPLPQQRRRATASLLLLPCR